MKLRFITLFAPALIAACADGPTSPAKLAPVPEEPNLGLFTPLLLPPGAAWGHSFVSFNPDRRLAVNVVKYPDGRASGSGFFAVPDLGVGTLRVTQAEGYGGCTPYASECPGSAGVPESSTSSGTGRLGTRAITFTLDLQSRLWPPPGWRPGLDPGTDYDRAVLIVCTSTTTCTRVEYLGELHHEPEQ